MTHAVTAYCGAAVHDGLDLHPDRALLVRNGQVLDIVVPAMVPSDAARVILDGGILVPGFVDCQVNGGDGVMFNSAPTLDTLIRMARAHRATGTAAILPTLITDTPAVTTAAIQAVVDAVAEGVSGIIGLHLEGPHLSVARKGAHDPQLIRPMEDADLAVLLAAAAALPNLMVTVAPEAVRPDQIAALADAGVIVSLGHSDASAGDADAAFAAGARCATHLFNAMSQFSGRKPGLVGATLNAPAVSAGLIADGIHVDPASIRLALRAKQAPGEVFLVSDAMAVTGSDLTEFTLNGRRILRADGRLTLEDGTLAGADLEMLRAVQVMVQDVGVSVVQAIRMATGAPAALLRQSFGFGRLCPGSPAVLVWLGPDLARRPLPVAGDPAQSLG
ncbi:N-acetylglucosamine-6-phosphate deacetylase [Pseudoruegeria sp. SK021]|uniref:N-acetylglucosamine-6-phosphate deacetylase n=1 Tax=Pseudoruegeria sp. SK021 TaxID=1933035 RepID=UPI000A25EC97|nr:N-acetylglucosamine-6-phosphate deacetylase [Pseudoruegeria sp. SK021]OSP54169.1 N-acetylglucosamine-6-phosphate deacetylase [Pseudoruegeria sp. SK021]